MEGDARTHQARWGCRFAVPRLERCDLDAGCLEQIDHLNRLLPGAEFPRDRCPMECLREPWLHEAMLARKRRDERLFATTYPDPHATLLEAMDLIDKGYADGLAAENRARERAAEENRRSNGHG